ncbi:putative RNA-directed DNA polymerase [Tanacetum coccineum]
MTGNDGGTKKEGPPDINSPFYIHASDYPKQMHVNDTLTDINYTDWSQEMLNFLFAKNKVGFIDGTLKKPKKTATDYMAWMRCDAMVKGWLTTAMEKDIRSSVKYANTASEIWSDLLERFGKESAPRAYELKQTLSNTHQTPRCTCNKCSCEMGKKMNELREKEKLYQFLMGLDTNFAVIKTQILAMNPIPTLGNAYHLVAEDERQRTISGEKKAPPESAAFKAFKPVRRENNASQNKIVSKYQNRGDTKEKCTECGRSGHTRDGCFKIIGYPDWWPGKVKPRAAHVETEASPVPGLTKEQYHSFLKHFAENHVKDGSVRMANMAGKRDWDSDWVVDSGSTEHITHDETILDNKFFCSNEEPVVIPNGDAIHKLHTRSLIGAGKCRKGLYRMGLLNGERRAMMTTGNTWHKRLGHASEDKLVIDDKTPFELVFSQKPDYDNMRVFGCLTYHRNTDTRGDKFEERGRPEVFMGYPQGTKGYKILDIKTGKIIISRDTKFFEEKFPFKSDDLIYEEVDALEPFNKPICNEIKNHVKPTVDEVHIDESTSSVETNRNTEDILSETLVQSRTTEGNEAQPDIPEELTRVKRNRLSKEKDERSNEEIDMTAFEETATIEALFNHPNGKTYYSLFIFKKDACFVEALIYVDDVIMVGNDVKKIQHTKEELDKRFSIKDLGALKYFLGIEVARTSEGHVLSQRKYILDILEDYGFQGCQPSPFPFEQNLILDKRDKEPKVDAGRYRRLIGRLLYLQATRPDIAYSVNVLSQFIADPRHSHMDAAHQVLRYLKGTVGQGILLPRDGGCNLIAYCDSDWLSCPITRRSRTGYLLLFGGAPISWKTKKQNVVSRSFAEAEYRSMASTVSKILWMRWLLKELKIVMTGPTPLFCDNQAARHIANNPIFHERTKHVKMDFYFIRERVESQEI